MAKLERVFGLTACSSSISIDQTTGLVAYPAGSTVVVYNPRTLSQANFSVSTPSAGSSGNTKNNQVTCLSFSDDGHYISIGEFGADPKVRVWQLEHGRQTNTKQLAELKYHRLGVVCVAFTKNSNYLISVGNQHDKSVVVWDWRKETKLAENRLTSQVNAMDVCESGRMFVTVGVRHVKFWYLESSKNGNGVNSVTLQGRSAILADHRNNTFIDVCCASNGRTFAITVTKLLVEFVDKKLVNIYELGGETPYALTLSQLLLFVGFGNGAIRALNIDTQETVLTLRRPHRLGFDIGATDTSTPILDAENNNANKYPDVHCMLFHARTRMLTVFYSDRSVYHWQLEEGSCGSHNELERCHSVKITSQFFHVGPIFDVQVPSVFGNQSTAGLFFTCSADETVRMWNLDGRSATSSTSASSSAVTEVCSSVLNELQKIFYIANTTDSLCEQPDKNFGGTLSDALESAIGIRCIRFSANSEHLACGGRDGNIYIFDLYFMTGASFADAKQNKISSGFSKPIKLEAHNGEVLCLDYSDPAKFSGRNLLASGSRDRLIHIFDAGNSYEHIIALDENSCSICAVKFVSVRESEHRLVACGTDKRIIINEFQLNGRDSSATATTAIGVRRLNQIPDNFGANFVCATQSGGRLVVACQDRQIRFFSMGNGELIRAVNGTNCSEGALTKLCLDQSETFAASVCSDRYVCIVDLANGECVAELKGQTDCITAIQFSADCRRLIVVSYNGCISVWRFSASLINKMNSRLARTGQISSSFSSAGNRCSTPDSVIESDSASAVAQKGLSVPLTPKGGSNSGSEFGSLTSINIAQDDDLDSGIGGRTAFRQVPSSSHIDAENRPFELKRISVEAIRRSNSNLHGVGVAQTAETNVLSAKEVEWNEDPNAKDSMQFANSPATMQNGSAFYASPGTLPNYYQYTQQQQLQQQQRLTGPPTAATSRSMSNLSQCRTHVSPQRGAAGRRRWNVGASPVTVNGNSQQQQQMQQQFGGQYMMPQQQVPYAQNVAFLQQQQQQYQQQQQQQYQQQQMPYYANNNNGGGGGISASVSLNALRANAASPSTFAQTPQQKPPPQQTQSAPRNGGAGVYYPASHFSRQSLGAAPASADAGIERKASGRNSFSKRYLKNIEQEKTLWKPGSTELRKRTTSNLFSAHPTVPQRQSNDNGVNDSVADCKPSKSATSTSAALSGGVRHSRSSSSIVAVKVRPEFGVSPNGNPTMWTSQHDELSSTSNGIDDASLPARNSGGSAPTGGGMSAHRSSSRILSRIKQQRRLSAALMSVSSKGPGNGAASVGGSARGRVDLAVVVESAAKITTSPLSSRRRNGKGTEDGMAELRARSKSPTQLAMQALASQQQQPQYHHQRESSSGSSQRGSTVSFLSQRRQTENSGSSSRLSNVRANAMEARLNEARAMLKKSQENLSALSALGDASGAPSAAAMARSRSIGNLRFGAAAAGLSQPSGLAGYGGDGDDYFGHAVPSSAEEGQSGGALLSGRQMARSVNSLLQDDGVDASPAPARLSLGGGGSKVGLPKAQNTGSRLAQSIRELRKNSNPDLTNDSLYEMDEEECEDQEQTDSPAFYSSATLPKNLRRGVQKKLERNNDANRRRSVAADGLAQSVSAMSIGGDGAAAEHAAQPKLSVGSAAARYVSYMNSARSVSSVEPRASHQRRTFDSLGGASVGSNAPTASARRAPNYLAQKFAGTDFVAPDVAPSHEELSAAAAATRHGSTTSIDALAAIDADTLQSQNSKISEMALHTSECIQEMTKACDKLLGARNLICHDTTIAGVERDALVAGVDRAIAAFRQRLDGGSTASRDF